MRTDRFRYIRNYFPDRAMLQAQYRDNARTVKDLKRLHTAGDLTEYQAAHWFGARPREELYELAADPHQMRNLAVDPAFKEELEKHRSLLSNWIETTGDRGQKPEDTQQLRATFELWRERAIFKNADVNPEYDPFRDE